MSKPEVVTFFEREKGDSGRVPDLRENGFYLYKSHHMFGWAPSYKNYETGEIFYYYENQLMTGSEVLADLKDRWRPVAQDEQYWFCYQMEAYFNVGTN